MGAVAASAARSNEPSISKNKKPPTITTDLKISAINLGTKIDNIRAPGLQINVLQNMSLAR